MPNRDHAARERLLVERCLEGDQSAWYALVEGYQRLVLSTVNRLLGAEARARDLADEIAANVWASLVVPTTRRLAYFDPARGRLSTFLAALARQEVQSHFRFHARRPRRVASDRPAAERSGRDNPLEPGGLLWQEFFATLTPRQREFVEVELGCRPRSSGRPTSEVHSRKLKQHVRARLRVFLEGD